MFEIIRRRHPRSDLIRFQTKAFKKKDFAHTKCDQIGQFLKLLGTIVFKISQNIWWTISLGILWNIYLNYKTTVANFLGNFW